VRFNSATLVTPPGQVEPPYDKVELLWFGETMPLPFLDGLMPRGSALTPGTAPRPVLFNRIRGRAVETYRLEILTCYEDMQTGFGRRAARAVRPALLTGMSNNSWFARTVATDWQERLSTMRAVELRTDLVRAVNGGVSSWVDASGRSRLRHRSGAPWVGVVTPRLRPDGAGETLYVRLGEWPVWGAIALTILIAAVAARRGRGRAA
jgi:apolipoprotein N-acyltransferase